MFILIFIWIQRALCDNYHDGFRVRHCNNRDGFRVRHGNNRDGFRVRHCNNGDGFRVRHGNNRDGFYGGPQVSRQKQKPHGKSKKLTAKARSSTAKARTSRQKQEPHSKSKNLTAEVNFVTCHVLHFKKDGGIRGNGWRALGDPRWRRRRSNSPYFFRGLKYEEIRMFLMKYHDIEMSLSTLKRRIKRMVYEGSYQITRSVTWEQPYKVLLTALDVCKGIDRYGTRCNSGEWVEWMGTSNPQPQQNIVVHWLFQFLFTDGWRNEVWSKCAMLVPRSNLRFALAVSFLLLPWASCSCRELLAFAVSFLLLPWGFCFCRDTCGPP